jgi:hypothetical protein
MTNRVNCEIFIAMNEEGDWIVTHDESDALNQLSNDVGGYQARVVKVTVTMAPPVMAEAEIEIPEEAGKEVETKAE